jgi:hypothetical protein
MLKYMQELVYINDTLNATCWWFKNEGIKLESCDAHLEIMHYTLQDTLKENHVFFTSLCN